MPCLRIACLAVVALVFAAAWSTRADAQIRRCIAADGQVTYTDRSCADVGGTNQPAPATQSPVYGGKSYARGCSRGLRELIFEVTAAIDSRDVNRLAGVYSWTGLSSRSGYAILDRLDAIANRPLLDVSAILPEPSLSLAADGAMTLSGRVPAQAEVMQDYPQAVVRRTPVALRVEQTLANGTTPSRTVFGLRKYMGCWWITL